LQHLLQLHLAAQQQLQQLAQIVPQQQQLIQQLFQIVAHQQQPYQQQPFQQQPYPQQSYQQWQPQLQSFAPMFSTPSPTGASGLFGAQSGQQPIFGGPQGYLM
jgi:hypothetical protein